MAGDGIIWAAHLVPVRLTKSFQNVSWLWPFLSPTRAKAYRTAPSLRVDGVAAYTKTRANRPASKVHFRN